MLWHTWFKSLVVSVGVMLTASGLASAPDSTKSTLPAPKKLLSAHAENHSVDSNYVFVLEVKHRVFTDFQEVDTVRMNEKFEIGDGEEFGQVFTFNPHLLITEKGQYLQVSDTLYNPAVRVRVYQKDSVVQESWAFYFADAPHFRRSDILGFRLLEFKVPDKFVRVKGPKMPKPNPADTAGKKSK